MKAYTRQYLGVRKQIQSDLRWLNTVWLGCASLTFIRALFKTRCMCKAQIFARKNMFTRHDIYNFKSGIWIVVMATWLFENNPLPVCRNSHDSYRSLYMDPSCFVRTGGQLPPAQTVIVIIFFDEKVNYHRKTKTYKVICQLHSYLSLLGNHWN